MGKGSALLTKRLREYPDQSLIAKNGELFCSLCAVVVDYSKSSVVKNHITSAKHERHRSTGQRQPRIDTATENQQERRSIWSQTASTFVAAGVPLHIFRIPRIRRWLSANLKHGHTMPSESTLRRYLVNEGENDIKETQAICKDKDVIIIVDETQDIRNRKVANLLVGVTEPNAKFRLVYSEILKKCDGPSMSQFIISGLNKADVHSSRVLALISDNAKYMLSAGKTLLLINPKCIHSTCWAHVLHLAAEDIRHSLGLADELIAKIKACLVKAPSRRQELLDSLERHGKDKKLPPTPVITRWATWLETGDFHHRNFVAVKEWIQKSEPDSLAMKKLQELIVTEGLERELETINLVFQSMASAIKSLESNNIPASDIMFILENIRGLLEMSPLLESGLDKLLLYLSGKHPSIPFWNDVQYFDPRKSWKFKTTKHMPVYLKRFEKTPIPLNELVKYENICSSFTADASFSPFTFWKNNARELPNLSELALRVLSIPASSAEVERSFSYLNRILVPIRSSLTIENLAIHLRLQFNNRESAKFEEEPGDEEYVMDVEDEI